MCGGLKVANSNDIGFTNLEVWTQITKHVCYIYIYIYIYICVCVCVCVCVSTTKLYFYFCVQFRQLAVCSLPVCTVSHSELLSVIEGAHIMLLRL